MDDFRVTLIYTESMKFRKNKKHYSLVNFETPREKGFSLIELLVAIFILTLMSSYLLVSMNGSRTKEELKAEARKVASTLRETQKNALTGKTVGGNLACAFGVSSSVGSSYNAYYTPSGNCSSRTNYVTYTLQNSVSISAIDISFSLPRADTGGGSVVLSKNGSTIQVCVSSSGQITEKTVNAALSCP